MAAALCLATALTACVTLRLPTMAHVHVGHAITAWPDTPRQNGLLDVAIQESKIAAEHANYAVEGARDIASVRMHLGHVLNAVDPSLEAEGPGTGYGQIRALDGSIAHLGFALEVRDASANLKAGLPGAIETLRQARRDAQLLAALARDGRRTTDSAQAVAYAQEARQRAETIAARLGQARRQLDAVLAAENPPYRPVARRYLFGIIRLPSGEWAFAPTRPSGPYSY